jgi:hypothetical protein
VDVTSSDRVSRDDAAERVPAGEVSGRAPSEGEGSDPEPRVLGRGEVGPGWSRVRWRRVAGFAGAGAALVGATVVATLAATHRSAVHQNARAYANGLLAASENWWDDVFDDGA